MAQTGYSKVQIYSSSTATNTPSAGNLTNDTNGSELAINITDGKLFYKDNSGTVQVLATKGGAFGTVTSVAATVPSFLSISGSPITSSGTLAIGLSGTALPTTSGGTGLASFTSGGAVYATSTSALTTGTLPEASGGTGTTTGYYGFKNRIINGAMVIDQRNAGGSVTPTASAYTLDRWFASISQSSKFSVQQNAGSVTPPVGFVNYLGVTSLSAYTVGASEFFQITQQIEGLNIGDLGWGTANAKTVTLSFQVYSSLTGTFGGVLANGAFNRSYPFSYSIPVANTWTTISITIAGDTSGTWLTTNGIGIYTMFSLGSGSTVSGTAGSWAGAGYRSATGATSVVGTNGATFYITGVQLEKVSTATSFDYRPYGTELALCQRYFEVSYDSGNAVGAATSAGRTSAFINAFNGNTSNYGSLIPFKVTKRASPTINWYGQNGTANQWIYCIGSNAGTYYGISTNLANQIGFEASTNTPNPTGLLTAGQVYLISGQWSASSEL